MSFIFILDDIENIETGDRINTFSLNTIGDFLVMFFGTVVRIINKVFAIVIVLEVYSSLVPFSPTKVKVASMERKHFESLGENFDRCVCRILCHCLTPCLCISIGVKVKNGSCVTFDIILI